MGGGAVVVVVVDGARNGDTGAIGPAGSGRVIGSVKV